MPIYEYVCSGCSERFSLIQSITSGNIGTKCPQCGSFDVKKMISSFCCPTSSDSSSSSSLPAGGFGGGG